MSGPERLHAVHDGSVLMYQRQGTCRRDRSAVGRIRLHFPRGRAQSPDSDGPTLRRTVSRVFGKYGRTEGRS